MIVIMAISDWKVCRNKNSTQIVKTEEKCGKLSRFKQINW